MHQESIQESITIENECERFKSVSLLEFHFKQQRVLLLFTKLSNGVFFLFLFVVKRSHIYKFKINK